MDCVDFARMIAEIAYEEGAREVVMNWHDEIISKPVFFMLLMKSSTNFPNGKGILYVLCPAGAAFLTISASDPELMKDVDPKRIARARNASRKKLREYSERLMSNRNIWCVASVPTPAWAKSISRHSCGTSRGKAVEGNS